VVSILDHHGSKWLRFIAAILKNQADAEDVVQEAVRRVLARNLPLSSREQVRMYLGRAIGNAALELYNNRKRERRRQIPIEDQILLPAQMTGPYASIEESEQLLKRDKLLGRIQEGLAHLSIKQYEALRLTILESRGLSIRDIGMNNGIPYSTLRHRSKQGLRHLRKFLQRPENNRSQKAGDRSRESESLITTDGGDCMAQNP
jgi:RNA polymerase sigma-70 factor, ECF subfamily